MEKTFKYHYLEVIAYKDQQVVRRFDITYMPKPKIASLDNSLNIQMNHVGYYTIIRDSDIKLETP